MTSQPPKIIADLMAALKEGAVFSQNLSFIQSDPICAPTGSRVICNPPVLDTDDDWLVWVPENLQDFAMRTLEEMGATHSDEQESYPDGICYRCGDVNPILIWDYDVFYRWVAATHYAAKLNLRDKAERTALFAAIVDMSVGIETLIL